MTAEATSALPDLPGSAGYADATAVFNISAPLRPDQATVADSVIAVAAAITRARSLGLDVEVISTGHVGAVGYLLKGGLSCYGRRRYGATGRGG